MGEPRGVTNEHHSSTDRAAAIKWRITELEEDIMILKLRVRECFNQKVRQGYTTMIDLCEQTIVQLKNDVKHIRK